jgi:hypothetical protein
MTMTHTTFDTLARQGSPFGNAGAFTVAKAAGHGARYDEFHATASNDHGPYFDAGFSQGAAEEAHGKLFDLFGVPHDQDAHGQRWDEFDWREMPALHGQHFDTGFATPIAGEGEHGTTWFDVFRGGATQARYIFNGIDHEGTVVDVAPEYATVQSRDGQCHEVTLQQFLAYRTPNEEQAGPAIPASDAEAPSARSADAHGAFEGQRQDVAPQIVDGAPMQAIPQGEARQARSDLLGGLEDTFDHVKTAADEVDVAKDMTGRPGCSVEGCDRPAKVIVQHTKASTPAVFCHSHALAQGPVNSWHEPTSAHHTSWPGSEVDPAVHRRLGKTLGDQLADVLKDVGITETAILGTPNQSGIDVPVREHKSTDHHSAVDEPKVCPHCGKPLAEEEHQSEQGAPSRKTEQGQYSNFDTVEAHKCFGTSLDVLKSLVAA